MHQEQRYPPDEGMRPEDQERGRDRKKKKESGRVGKTTRSLFVAFIGVCRVILL